MGKRGWHSFDRGMAALSDPCPICQRPHRRIGEQHDDAAHCPNSSVERVLARGPGDCLRLGLEVRDRLIAQNVAALKQRDELLARARELLVGVHAGLTEALERLPEVADG